MANAPKLRHCLQWRRPFKRTDIKPPNASVAYKEIEFLPLQSNFSSIAVYEFHCPSCLKSSGRLSIYAWVGEYHRGGKSDLQKIEWDQADKWLQWIGELKITEDVKGSDTVTGSQSLYPYRYMSTIPVY